MTSNNLRAAQSRAARRRYLHSDSSSRMIHSWGIATALVPHERRLGGVGRISEEGRGKTAWVVLRRGVGPCHQGVVHPNRAGSRSPVTPRNSHHHTHEGQMRRSRCPCRNLPGGARGEREPTRAVLSAGGRWGCKGLPALARTGYQDRSDAQAGSRRRNSRQAAATSDAFRMADTTQMRVAPAASTESKLPR